jgi:hypothetical protein
MATMVTGPTEVSLWGGWSITLPASRYQREKDGSWSAWGHDWAIDIHIIETAGDKDGSPVSAERILGDANGAKRIEGNGWTATFQRLVEKEDGRDVYRLAGRLGAENTLMVCWISYVRQEQGRFAEELMHAVSHNPARAV